MKAGEVCAQRGEARRGEEGEVEGREGRRGECRGVGEGNLPIHSRCTVRQIGHVIQKAGTGPEWLPELVSSKRNPKWITPAFTRHAPAPSKAHAAARNPCHGFPRPPGRRSNRHFYRYKHCRRHLPAAVDIQPPAAAAVFPKKGSAPFAPVSRAPSPSLPP